MNYRAQAYQQSHLLTAARGDVLLALYDGALRFVIQARQSIDRRDYSGKAEAISRASSIIEELSSVLDHKRAPDLCGSLAALYSYYVRQLHRANAELNSAHLDELERHLTNLRQTWQQAVFKARQEGHRV